VTVLVYTAALLHNPRSSKAHAPRQAAEVHVRCAILNTFNRLGMPVTVAYA